MSSAKWAQIRSSHAWQLARKRALEGATHCAWCHRPLRFDVPPRSKWAPSVDHIVPLSLGGDPFDQANLRVLHVSCNSVLGGRLRARQYRRRLDRARWW